ncbi:MAG: UDP-N-acetylmuramoyl-tripeptide--D-alanyl-D-alanine ligase [Candidatus Omnitrophota bacterium]
MFSVRDILNASGGRLHSNHRKRPFTGVSIDSRTVKKGEIFIAIMGERFDGHDFIGSALKRGACGIIISRIPDTLPRGATVIMVKDTLTALGDIAAFHRERFDIPIVGITGSNGKTSVKELLFSLLSSKYKVLKNRGTENNFVGLPMTLLGLSGSHDAAVLELGASHLGEIGRLTDILKPTIGVITNIGESHLESLRDKKGVFKAKSEMALRMAEGSLLVLNGDDPMLSRVKTKCKISKFGLKAHNAFRATNIISRRKISFVLNDAYPLTIKAIGRHNVYNALAAIAAASRFNISIAQIRESLADIRPPKMRMEEMRINGITVINDAYNSNPLSLKSAVEAFSSLEAGGKKIMVSGDMLELGKKGRFYHDVAGRIIAKASIDRLITVGELSRYTAKAASKAGMKGRRLWSCSDTAEAAGILKDIASSGDTILIKGSRAMGMERVTRNL